MPTVQALRSGWWKWMIDGWDKRPCQLRILVVSWWFNKLIWKVYSVKLDYFAGYGKNVILNLPRKWLNEGVSPLKGSGTHSKLPGSKIKYIHVQIYVFGDILIPFVNRTPLSHLKKQRSPWKMANTMALQPLLPWTPPEKKTAVSDLDHSLVPAVVVISAQRSSTCGPLQPQCSDSACAWSTLYMYLNNRNYSGFFRLHVSTLPPGP